MLLLLLFGGTTFFVRIFVRIFKGFTCSDSLPYGFDWGGWFQPFWLLKFCWLLLQLGCPQLCCWLFGCPQPLLLLFGGITWLDPQPWLAQPLFELLLFPQLLLFWLPHPDPFWLLLLLLPLPQELFWLPHPLLLLVLGFEFPQAENLPGCCAPD